MGKHKLINKQKGEKGEADENAQLQDYLCNNKPESERGGRKEPEEIQAHTVQENPQRKGGWK